MEDNSQIYGRQDFEITLVDGNPVALSNNSIKFKRLVIQCPINNAGSIFCGGEDPKIELVNNASQDFFGGYLNKVFVKGTASDLVTGFYEF